METVRNPLRIGTLLRQLQSGRCPLVVAVYYGFEKIEIGQSLLREVNFTDRTVLLDELVPSTANLIITEKKQLSCTSLLDSLPVSFTTSILGASGNTGTPGYRLTLPALIDYAQQREDHRHCIDRLTRPGVRLVTQTGERYSGELIDISAGGLGVLLQKASHLREGMLLPDLQLQLQDTVDLACVARVRHIRADSGTSGTAVGLQMMDLSKIQTRILRRAMLSLGQCSPNTSGQRSNLTDSRTAAATHPACNPGISRLPDRDYR